MILAYSRHQYRSFIALGIVCRATAIIAVLLLAILLVGCTDQPTVFDGKTFGTSYHIVVADDLAEPAQVHHAIKQRLVEIDAVFSTWKVDSAISRLNANPTLGEWIPTTAELVDLLVRGKQISEQTDGAFEQTIAPLVRLWGFGSSKVAIDGSNAPTLQQINAAKSIIGSEMYMLQQHGSFVKKLKPVVFDLSAIAKGYAVDEISTVLIEFAAPNHLVEIGGEIVARGSKFGSAWRVAIEQPEASNREIQVVVPLTNTAMATSGDYRNYYVRDGERYSHIIDPRSGRPIHHRLASVTVLAETCWQADALATAFMVLGVEKSRQIANQLNVGIYMLEHDGDIMRSTQNKRFAELTSD